MIRIAVLAIFAKQALVAPYPNILSILCFNKVYFIDPLSCPACGRIMKIISVIEDDAAIKKIFLHLDLWLTQNHDPPLAIACCVPSPSQSYRSYEWWEAPNSNIGSDYSDNSYAQSPYEDEYSQAEPWEY